MDGGNQHKDNAYYRLFTDLKKKGYSKNENEIDFYLFHKNWCEWERFYTNIKKRKECEIFKEVAI